MPDSMRAAYFQRPARRVVAIAERTHTARKDLWPSAAEDDTFGIRSARKVEKWTG